MRLFIVSFFVAALAVTSSAQRADVTVAATPSKLTTVLADLAGTVSQDGGAPSAARAKTTATVASTLDQMPRSVQDAMKGRLLRIDDNNGVQVYILMSAVTDDTVKQLTDAGVTIEIKDAAHNRVQARVPASRLQMVSQLAVVNSVRLPTYGRRRTGAVTSEGDAILNAATARATYLVDGTGIRVGVISDGIKGIFATGCLTCADVTGGPISSGDLPAASGTRNANGVLNSAIGGILGRSFQSNGDLEGLPPALPACSFAGAGAEGTALLEIVHDVAPGAKLSFANGDTDLAFNQAVNFLAASNDVVLDDIGFFGLPYDGTSTVSANTAAALNNPSFPIRAYFTSVGNDADEHYYGAYADSGVDGTTVGGIATGGHLHLFQSGSDTTDILGLGAQPYNLISLPSNGEVAIFLSWNDTFGASANNYDLYLVQQSTGKVVASSTDPQNGRQDPVEVIDYVNKGAQDFFRIVVQNVGNAAQPRNLNIFSFQPECAPAGPALLSGTRHERHNYNTATHSVSAQGDAGGSPVSVVSVGAICSASVSASSAFPTDESCRDTSYATAEFFSSQGPTLDGRVKPDIAGIDGVSITGAGSFTVPFFGTSAASPHLGAIAALVLQATPCLQGRSTSTIDATTARKTIRSTILNSAAALSSAPPDNVFGYGRADAFAAVGATRPVFKGSQTTITVDGNTTLGASLSPDQLGFIDPNTCQLNSLNWSGGCGTPPGATMTCGFGANAVSVSASNNAGITYSDAVALTVNVTNFAINVTPGSVTLPAGKSTSAIVAVTPMGGPYNTPVLLTCASGNLPPGTSCTFNPPTVVPGTTGATSVMTLTTLASSTLPVGVDWRDTFLRPALRRVPWTPAALMWLLAATAALVSLRKAPAAHVALAARALVIVATIGSVAYLGGAIALASMDPGIALFPSGLTFPTQNTSTSSPTQFVYMTNIGADANAITSITTSGDFGQVNNCGTSLAAGATCTIAVNFTPTATGARTGSLSVVDTAAGSPHTVALTGTGQTPPTSNGGTPSGSYGISINGTAGTLTNVGTLTLTVQ